MKTVRTLVRVIALLLGVLVSPSLSIAADHNDPNSINSIFYDVPSSAADLYDLFGWPSDEPGEEKVIIALTFGAVPAAGHLDPHLLYRINISPSPRTSPDLKDDVSLAVLLGYFKSVTDKYIHLHPGEVRVTVDAAGKASVTFANFPGGDFAIVIPTNESVTHTAKDGSAIKIYVGGRDDAFFNDLPGFFRSINYGPQFYKIKHTAPLEMRELKIPKTLLELEGNQLFNFDPKNPRFGHDPATKIDLPSGPHTLSGKPYLKDANGNFRFAYTGEDAQAGKNINAVILEIPVKYLTKSPERDRVINAWGESWVRKASDVVDTIPDDRPPMPGPLWFRHPWLFPWIVIILGLVLLYFGIRSLLRGAFNSKPLTRWKKIWSYAGVAVGLVAVVIGLFTGKLLTGIAKQKPVLTLTNQELDEQLRKYKMVDTDGLPFADAALNLREDNRQLGAYNFWLGPHFVTRLAHLGWGFGPSIDALGIKSSFDHGGSPVSVHKEYTYAGILDAFSRGKKVIFQKLNMPDDSWKKNKAVNVPLRRPIEIFIPNVCAIDMDTNGTWPFGRRPEDQVATRFLSLFLDMSTKVGDKQVNVETLGDPELWKTAHIEPKSPPNPLKNDKPFLTTFPYLADPWPENYSPSAPSPASYSLPPR